jgi:MOSC domain-containing protein YiiM
MEEEQMGGTTGRVERIWLKRMKGGPMDPQARATLVAGRGLAGNANQGGTRQITILSRETWERITAPLPEAPDPARRRANLLVSGVDLANSRGQVLRVGGHRIRIHGETRPCEQMEAAADGLRAGLSEPWGGGVFGEALDDGEIAVGDVVTVSDH